jgi:bla regulator protein blaR1
MKSGAFFAAAMVAGLCLRLGAQSAELKFEVASIKPNTFVDGPTEMGTQPGGRVTIINVPLRLLIRNAYEIQDSQLVDAPQWIAEQRFDIVAKANGEIPRPVPGNPGPLQGMMRSLLAERFKLAVHRETREIPAYTLQFARSDRRLGPQLHPSRTDCAALAASGRPQASPDQKPRCGVRANGGHMLAGGLPVAQLATLLSTMVDRTVVDRTGLSGAYDFELNWTPDRTPRRLDAAPSSPDNPSIFTALREQLGLKLESAKTPTEVLIIDHVERPTPN